MKTTMIDIFETLFGSKAKVRMLRLFLLNAEKEFSAEEIAEKTLLRKAESTRELHQFVKIKLVHERTRKGKKVYATNPNFPFFVELHGLFAKSDVDVQSKAFQKLSGVGEVRLVLVSGVFINYAKSKADMILVVNSLNRTKLKAAMSYLEAEVGRDVRFVLMNSEELQYRLNMMDRFLMEFFEHPHREVINKVPEIKRFVSGLKR
jgi:hypothetical protein